MLHENFDYLNGFHTNGVNGTHTLECPSDYEARPAEPPQTRARGNWRDQIAPVTHNMSWVDSDGCSHSVTLRGDTMEEVLEDLKLIKAGIRQAKANAAARKAGEQAQVQAQPDAPVLDEDIDVQPCKIHGVDMARRFSKRTGGHYFAHKLSNGDFCYGRKK